MGRLSRWLSRFCYKHPNCSIPGLMKYIAIGNVAVFLLDMFSGGYFSPIISFIPAAILRGQVWRLITFIFVPLDTSPIFVALSVMMYYFLGNQLERTWGSTRFTVFYFTGVLMTVLAGLLLALTPLGQYALVDMTYVNLSLLLAFASLYPDAMFTLYFFIPVKGKWLAWLYVAMIGYNIFRYVSGGLYLLALIPAVAVLNYLLFFWDDLKGSARQTHRRVQYQTSRQTINFHAAQRQAQQQKGYLHKCSVCGVTDTDQPEMEFRYCSKCSGYHCYCINHINSHVHVQ